MLRNILLTVLLASMSAVATPLHWSAGEAVSSSVGAATESVVPRADAKNPQIRAVVVPVSSLDGFTAGGSKGKDGGRKGGVVVPQ